MWLQRASCVAFVTLARSGNHNETILEICESAVKNQERFVQLGVGWVLRELYLAVDDQVVEWIKSHFSLMSREGLRYSVEKMPASLRSSLMSYSPDEGVVRAKRKQAAAQEVEPATEKKTRKTRSK